MLYLQHIKISLRWGLDKWLLWSVFVPPLSHSLFLDYHVAFWQRICMVELGTGTVNRGGASPRPVSVMIPPMQKKSVSKEELLGGFACTLQHEHTSKCISPTLTCKMLYTDEIHTESIMTVSMVENSAVFPHACFAS